MGVNSSPPFESTSDLPVPPTSLPSSLPPLPYEETNTENIKQQIKTSIVLLIDVLLLFVSGMVLTYAKWWSWYGGNSWGPRFFLIGCVPASLILAIWLSDRQQKMIGLVSGCFILILSSWVCIQGFVYAEKNLEICTQNNYTQEFLCWYTPEFSPIWRQFITTFETNINAIQILFVG